MEIFELILIGIPVMLLFGMGIMGCGSLIREIWGIIRGRKPVDARPIVWKAIMKDDLIQSQHEYYNFSPASLDYIGAAPKKKWVTPHVSEEERPLEFTGIRAIQL